MKNNKLYIKIVCILNIIMICLALFPAIITASSVSISGASSVKVGDTFTTTITIYQDNIFAAEGSLSYSSNLQYVSATGGASSNSIFAFILPDDDDSDNKPSSITVTVTFKAISAGTAYINVNLDKVIDNNDNLSSASSSKTVNVTSSSGSGGTGNTGGNTGGGSSSGGSTNKSSNNYISSISVAGFEILPAFDKNVQEYSVYVPFATEALDISVDLESSYASYQITDNVLLAGETTPVLITVTAENGESRVYTLYTAREQDPNYVPSDNSFITSITPSVGSLSPIFDKNRFSYTIEVGYEVNEITFTATTENSRATYNVLGDTPLHSGKDNFYYVVCTAENGESRIYTINVKKTAAYEEYLSTSFINSVVKEIKSGANPVAIDLSHSAVAPISAKIFEALAEMPSTTLIIKTKNGTITFESEDILFEITQDWYDLTLNNSSQFSEDILPGLASYSNYIASTHFTDELPGYANFAIYTDLQPGIKVNIYFYNSEDGSYSRIARNVTVGEGGVVSFDVDRGGDFVITTRDLSASDYSSQNRKVASRRVSNQVLVFSGFIICAGIGFALGAAVYNKKSFKKAKKSNKKISKQKDEKIKTQMTESELQGVKTDIKADIPEAVDDTINENDEVSFVEKLESIMKDRNDTDLEE